MQVRRFLLALTLTATVGLAAGCGEDTDPANPAAAPSTTGGTSSSAAPAGSAASAAPTGDLKANTDAVCKAVVAAYDKEKEPIMKALIDVVTANTAGDKAALAKAQADGKVIMDRLRKVVDVEIAKAQDPAAKAALQKFVTSFEEVLTGNGFNDPNFEANMDAISAEAGKYCPALNE